MSTARECTVARHTVVIGRDVPRTAGDPHHSNGGHCLSSSGCLLPKMDSVRAGVLTRIGVVLAVCAVAATGDRAGRLHDERDARVRCREHPARATSRCTRSGAAPTACPGSCWPRSARSSRATGAIPARTSRTRAACSARCSSRPARTRPRGASTPPATRASAARGASGARSSGHPPYRMDDPDDEIAAAAAKIASDAGAAHLWPRALWRYNALHSYRKTVLRRAARFGMSSACGLLEQVGAGFARAAARVADVASAPSRSAARWPRRPGACSPTTRSRSRPRPPTTSPTASPTGASSRCWPGSPSATSIVVSGHQDRPPALRDGTHKVSNHWYGRAATISEVDGQAVAPGSAAAAALWDQLQDGAQGVPAGRDRRALVGARQSALVQRARRAGGDPRRLRRRRAPRSPDSRRARRAPLR